MRILVLILLPVLVLLGCSSNPHKAEKIETDMERSQNVQGENVGLKDGNMVVQRKRFLAEELRRLQVGVYEQEDRVYGNRELGSWGLYGVLKDCKKKLSSKKFGGTGKLSWMEKLDRVTDQEEDLKLGIDENDDLVAVKEEFIKDRIKRFKRYKKILNGREDEFQTKIDVCKAELDSRVHDMQKASN